MTPHLASRSRGQAGITLIEVLVALAIAATLLGPVATWMVLTVTTQGSTASRFNDAAQARLLETYVTRDVASSEKGSTTSPIGCRPDSAPILDLTEQGTDPKVIEYGIAPSGDGVGDSLWRWECQGGSPSEETEVVRGVVGSPPATATCQDIPSEPCKHVEVTAELPGRTLMTSATRRSTNEVAGVGGSSRPYVSFEAPEIVPRTGTGTAFQVTLTAAVHDADPGDSHSFAWLVPGASDLPDAASVTVNISDPGTYVYAVTVTDLQGNSITQTAPVTLRNLPPVIDPSVTTDDGTVFGLVGRTKYTFTANASDPDGSVDSVTWQFPGGKSDPLNQVFTNSGRRRGIVTVTDNEGLTASQSVYVEVRPGTIALIPVGLNLNSVFSPPLHVVDSADPIPVTFRSTDSHSDDAWTLRMGGDVLASGVGPELPYEFPGCSRGTYSITQKLNDTDGTEVTEDFQLGWELQAGFSFAAPAGTGPVEFLDTSTIAGCVTGWNWNFGFVGDGWSTTAQNPIFPFDYPGRYTVSLAVTDATGRTSQTTQDVVVPGAPLTPNPPRWVGSDVEWDPIPGVELYRISTGHYGTDENGDNCLTGGVNVDVGPEGPFTTTGGVNTCPVPSSSNATLSVFTNGVWSAPSAPAVTP